MVEEEGFGFGLCPSFSSYSIDGFSEAVARVTGDSGGFDVSDHCSVSGKDHSLIFEEIEKECEKEEDFEFVLLQENEPAFPIFNHGVLEKEFGDRDNEGSPAIRISLEQLLLGDRNVPSSSSSEADEMDQIPPGTYCMWTPKTVEVADGRCKKSKSTGSSSSPSKRWRIRALLRRSISDGKSSAAFLTPSSISKSTKNEEKDEKLEQLGAAKSSGESKATLKSNGKRASAHEVFYVHNRRLKEEVKKKSYLPYKQDLIRLWINFNIASGKPFLPF